MIKLDEKKIVWIASSEGRLSMGPYDTQLQAWDALRLRSGLIEKQKSLFAKDPIVWPYENMSIREEAEVLLYLSDNVETRIDEAARLTGYSISSMAVALSCLRENLGDSLDALSKQVDRDWKGIQQ